MDDKVKPKVVNIVVLTVSDTRTEADDKSGQTLVDRIKKAGHHLVEKRIVKDEVPLLQAALKEWIAREDVDVVIPHQANRRIIETVSEKLNVNIDKFFINIHKYGNTSAASIPIALHEARESGRLQSGTLSLLTVLGAGITWGAAAIRW